MKLRDTNEPRQRTMQERSNAAPVQQTAPHNTDRRTDGRTGRTDGRTDGPKEWMDRHGGIDGRTIGRGPTFRTNWSHEILRGDQKETNEATTVSGAEERWTRPMPRKRTVTYVRG